MNEPYVDDEHSPHLATSEDPYLAERAADTEAERTRQMKALERLISQTRATSLIRPALDIPRGALIEIELDDEATDQFRARFCWNADQAERGFDGEGTGPTLDEAVRAALLDTED